MKKLFITILMVSIINFTVDAYSAGASFSSLVPAADGHYHYSFDSCGLCPDIWDCGIRDCEELEMEINNGIKVEGAYWKAPGHGARIRTGIVEFDISTIDSLLTGGEMQATILLKVKDGNCCFILYGMQDHNENGAISENDIETEEYIGEVCTQEQSGNSITFDVTAALEHDLFTPDQTEYSGFVLKGCEYGFIEFYDHTDPENAPRLSISGIDSDGGAAAIPTLSEWGLIIFMTIILGRGVVTLVRRRMV